MAGEVQRKRPDKRGEKRVPVSGAWAGVLAVLSVLGIAHRSCAQRLIPEAGAPAQKLEFDVASVRPDRSGGKPKSNVPLGPGDIYSPSNGILNASNFTLLRYIEFAYGLSDYQVEALRGKGPGWMADEKFDIEARTENRDATKDEFRRMMQSLLADRFRLAVHSEMRETLVFSLVLVAPGRIGPRLQHHPADASCPMYGTNRTAPDGTRAVELPETTADGFPTYCGGIVGLPASAQDRYRFGARDVPMTLIARSLSSWGSLGRPVVDATRLTGRYDFVVEFTPEPAPAYATTDSGGPTFREALKKQLGLKMEPETRAVEFLVIDRVEHPTPN